MRARLKTTSKAQTRPSLRSLLRQIVKWFLIGIVLVWTLDALILISVRWIDPPTTAVQIQRRMQSWFNEQSYEKRFKFVPINQISPNLQHAVVAAEDARFYQHHGFDWQEVQIAVQDDLDGERSRGASTLTQQLVKNLLFGTRRSWIRKGAEATLVPVAEFVLGKERILELYLNVVEWGPGVYGAEAASRFHEKTSARKLSREQAAQLAAILPSPLKRKPERMTRYSAIILTRMQQMGW